MTEDRKTIDSPDEKSVGSRDPKEPIPDVSPGGGGEDDGGAGGSGGTVRNQDNPTSVPAG